MKINCAECGIDPKEISHTPTPWKVEGTNRREIVADDTLIATTEYFPGDGKRNDDPYCNAAFIVRAVNAHEELLKMLRMVYRELETPDIDILSVHKLVGEAIAKAEGR